MTDNRAFFDTALFIYALELKDEQARALFSDALECGELLTSAITVMEYCTGCFKAGHEEYVRNFRRFLDDYHFIVQDITEEIAVEAARIRAEYPFFRGMDALQLACAKSLNATEFYTSDRQLRQFKDDTVQVKTHFIS